MSTVLEQPAVPVAPPATPGTQPPAVPAPPADGSAVPSPGASSESVGLRQLREQYEATKRERDQWGQLGKFEEVSQRAKVGGSIYQESAELAQSLGYDTQDLQAAFDKDPVATLLFLRQKAAEATPQPLNQAELKKQLDKLVEQRLAPITARENERLIEEANGRFQGEFDRLYKETFKDGLPDDCRDAIREMAEQLFADDDAALGRLKGGQIADVNRYFQAAQTRFLQIVNSYLGHERKRTGGEQITPPSQPLKPKSALDGRISTGQSVRELFNI